MAAAPPNLSSATPTVWLATPIFNGFLSFPTSKCSRKPRAVPRCLNLRFIDIKTADFHVKAIRQCIFRPTNFDKETPPMGTYISDMSVDSDVGSMIPEDLSTKCIIGSMIQSDPTMKFDSRSWIPLDPSVIFGIGSRIPSDPRWNWWCRIYDLRIKRGSKRIPRMYQAFTTLFLDKISTKSYDNACCVYISMKNVVNKKNIKDT